MPNKLCKICGKNDSERPLVFRGEEFCCDDHRKMLTGEMEYDGPAQEG